MQGHNRKLSICGLVPYPVDIAPSQRFRIEQWIPGLDAQGISVDILPFADEALMDLLHQPGHRAAKLASSLSRSLRRFADVISARRYDAVLIHRAASIGGPATAERFLALLGPPVIYDFDDAIFKLHTTEANRHFGWLKFPGKTATICRIASHVVVGNAWLADYALRFNPRVTVIPSSIDTGQYVAAPNNGTNGKLVIGWMGSSTSQTYLEMSAPLLRELKRRRDVELRVISDREPVLPDIEYTWRAWSADSEVKELSHFDIGIMPMPDDEWAKGKCALKALQYMAMGVPTICSAVGANCEVIQHGENGLLASSDREWIANLDLLIDKAELRQRLGAMGRRTVEERYSTSRCAELFARVVRETIEEKQRASAVVKKNSVPVQRGIEP